MSTLQVRLGTRASLGVHLAYEPSWQDNLSDEIKVVTPNLYDLIWESDQAWFVIPPVQTFFPNHWEHILRQLDEVMQDDDYDEDYLRPSESAYTRTKNFLYEAYKVFAGNLRIPYFVPGGDGGLRIEWEHQGREARLLWPARDTEPGHIYFEEGEVCGLEEAALNNFLRRLAWLFRR